MALSDRGRPDRSGRRLRVLQDGHRVLSCRQRDRGAAPSAEGSRYAAGAPERSQQFRHAQRDHQHAPRETAQPGGHHPGGRARARGLPEPEGYEGRGTVRYACLERRPEAAAHDAPGRYHRPPLAPGNRAGYRQRLRHHCPGLLDGREQGRLRRRREMAQGDRGGAATDHREGRQRGAQLPRGEPDRRYGEPEAGRGFGAGPVE